MFGEPTGQGWTQIWELLLALLLCSLIGLERELKQKSAGLRTHTLVGVGAALFLLVSKYGFTDVLAEGRIVLDPSRVAAQIVSGIGFIGGGLIFVRRDVVRGLTTAAHFLVVYGYPPLIRLATRTRPATSVVRVTYRDGEGALRTVLELATRSGYSVEHAITERRSLEREEEDEHGRALVQSRHLIDLRLRLVGPRNVNELLTALADQPGILAVETGDIDDRTE